MNRSKSTENRSYSALPPPSSEVGHPGICTWCREYRSVVQLVRIIEQGSGAGVGQYACSGCCRTHKLVPVAEKPLTVSKAPAAPGGEIGGPDGGVVSLSSCDACAQFTSDVQQVTLPDGGRPEFGSRACPGCRERHGLVELPRQPRPLRPVTRQ
jgi:hypothetical protein